MKTLLSFSIIAVLAMVFDIGCKQDSISTGSLSSSAPVHKAQQPASATGTSAANGASKAQNKAVKPQEVTEYKVHLIDVLKDPFDNPTIYLQCNSVPSASIILNGDLDVNVDPSGEWHMTVSNFKAMDWATFTSYFGNTPNDIFNAAIADNTESSGVLFVGSDHWIEDGGHYEGAQKEPVSIIMTDPVSSAHFILSVHFTRSASGEFSCDASYSCL